MAQYSKHNTTILKVKRSEVQPDDVIIGPAPSYLPSNQPLVRLSRERERNVPPKRLQKPKYFRRTSSLDRGDFLTSYRDRDMNTQIRTRGRDQPYEDFYDSEGPIARRQTRRRDRRKPENYYDSEGSIPPRRRRSASAKQGQKRQQSNR